MEWIVQLPLKVQLSKKSQFILNLNHYRNAHYQTLNKAKILFKELIQPLIAHIPPITKCSLQYIYYPPSVREVDISNVCSVVDKFFSDAFVESGKLPDDNYKYLNEVTYLFGEVDSKNPRIEVIITKKEIYPMKLIIDSSELQLTVSNHLAENYNIEVEPHQIDLGDVEDILININPTDTVGDVKYADEAEPRRKRTRRSSAVVAAEKAAKEAEIAVKATLTIDEGNPASTRTLEEVKDVKTSSITQVIVDEPTTPSEMVDTSESPVEETPKPKSIFA